MRYLTLIFREVEIIMSEKILNTMYGAMKIHD